VESAKLMTKPVEPESRIRRRADDDVVERCEKAAPAGMRTFPLSKSRLAKTGDRSDAGTAESCRVYGNIMMGVERKQCRSARCQRPASMKVSLSLW